MRNLSHLLSGKCTQVQPSATLTLLLYLHQAPRLFSFSGPKSHPLHHWPHFLCTGTLPLRPKVVPPSSFGPAPCSPAPSLHQGTLQAAALSCLALILEPQNPPGVPGPVRSDYSLPQRRLALPPESLTGRYS